MSIQNPAEYVYNFSEKLMSNKIAPTEETGKLLNGQVISKDKRSILCVKVAHFVGQHRNELGDKELLLLKSALQCQINRIREETSGVSGFFKFLFKPGKRSEINQSKKHYKLLEAFVSNLIKAREQVNQNNQVNRAAEEGVVNNMGINPQSPRNVPSMPSNNVPAPVHGEEVPPPPVNVEEAPFDDEIPPPPPNPQDAPVASFKFSDDEPNEPNLDVAKYQKLPNETTEAYKMRMNDEIAIIKDYTAKVNAAMAEAKEMKRKASELEEKIPETRVVFAERKANYEKIQGNIKTLEKPDPIVYLRLPNRDPRGKIVSWEMIPYFKGEDLEKNNQLLINAHQKPIPKSLNKEVALAYFQNQLPNAQRKNEKYKKTLEQEEKTLQEIKSKVVRGLDYTKLMDELTKKQKKLEIWEIGKRNREKALETVVKVKNGNVQPVATNQNLFDGHAAIKGFSEKANIILKRDGEINNQVFPQ